MALDFETTGKYPLEAEICEIALIKFQGEEVLDEYSTLVRPSKPMNQAVIDIHGITNEMVKSAPTIDEVLPKVVDFIKGMPMVGHNLPFDLGFLAWELEKHNMPLWDGANFCTSLLSLELLPKLSSHRLRYLADYYKMDEAPNHRAHQDALTCMKVFLRLIEGHNSSPSNLEKLQKDSLALKYFSVLSLLEEPKFFPMIEAVIEKKDFELIYSKGSRRDSWRKLNPMGLVLKTKDESFLVAADPGDDQSKRFMLSKITQSRSV